MKIAARLQFTIIFLSFFGFFIAAAIGFTIHVYAINMSNSLYYLQMGNLDSFASRKSGSGYILQDTGGELGPGLYSGTNYIVRAGFQYVPRGTQFSFKVSSQLVDFGTLSASNPVTRTQTLTISNGSTYGYQVTASENHQLLESVSGARIPDTSCDNGTCTPSTPATWTNPLTYGLGYRCDNVSGSGCIFSTANQYAPFANKEYLQTPQAILSGSGLVKSAQSTITYKVNVSGTQGPGDYTNTINYIATPTF